MDETISRTTNVRPPELQCSEVLSEVQAALEFAQALLETVCEWLPSVPAETRLRLGIALARQLEAFERARVS